MQTTIRLGRLKYRISAPTNTQPILAKLRKTHPDMPWDEVRSHLTPEALLAARVKELTQYALKCTGKHRKARLCQEPRIFPKEGLSAMEYVHSYYSLNNLGTPSHFAPLAKHITRPRGIDSQINF